MTLSLKTVHVMYMAALLSLSVTQVSAAINGTYFSHKNWEVACDNTGTCRAVGYQADDHAPAAVLLTRQAGANTATQVALSFDPEVNRPIGMELWIGQRKITHIRFTEDIGRLSSQHANLVLNAIKNDQPVSLRAGQQQWRISGSGAHAVMLKMDDVQKRTATTSALLKTGQKPVTHVLAAQAKPKIQIPRIISQSYSIARQSPQGQQLIKMLRQSTSAEQCGFLHGNNQQADQIQVFNLNAQTRLVQIPCWMAAYNSGDGFWLMDAELKRSSNGSLHRHKILSQVKSMPVNVAEGLAIVAVRIDGHGMVRHLYRAMQPKAPYAKASSEEYGIYRPMCPMW